MNTTKSRIFIFSAIGIIILSLFIIYMPVKREVDIDTKMIMWQNNNADYTEFVDVKIDGVYSGFILNVRKADIFDGVIEIEGITDKIENKAVSFGLFDGCGMIDFTNNGHWIGNLHCNNKMSEICIFINEKTDSYQELNVNNLRVISYPANDRETAIEIAEKLCENTWLETAEFN